MNDFTPSRIFYTKPSITELETGYVTDAVTTGWGERCYEYIVRFEQALAAHLWGDQASCWNQTSYSWHSSRVQALEQEPPSFLDT